MPVERVALCIVLVLAGAAPYVMLKSKAQDPKWRLYSALFEALEQDEPGPVAESSPAHERKLV